MRRAEPAQKRAWSGGGKIKVSLRKLCPGEGLAVWVSIHMHIFVQTTKHFRARFKLL